MAEVEFTWALDGYCARYGFLAQPESICQKLKQKTKAQQLQEDERLCCSVLGQYRRTLEEWKL